MAAHLPRQEGVLVEHGLLDDGVAGGAHQGSPAEPLHGVEEDPGSLDLGDDRGTGVRLQEPGCEKGERPVAEDRAAEIVDHPEPVGIPVVGKAQIGPRLSDRLLHGFEVGLHRGIGMVVGEPAVHFAEERDDPASERFEDLAGNASGSVAGIDHDLEGSVEAEFGHQSGLVGLPDRHGFTPGNRMPRQDRRRRGRDVREVGDLAAMHRVEALHDLEPVVLGRVVAAGDHHGHFRAERVGGEVGHRRGLHPEVDETRTACRGSRRQIVVEVCAGGSAVPPDRDAATRACGHRQGVAKPPDGILVEIARIDAANVIFPEDIPVHPLPSLPHGHPLRPAGVLPGTVPASSLPGAILRGHL